MGTAHRLRSKRTITRIILHIKMLLDYVGAVHLFASYVVNLYKT